MKIPTWWKDAEELLALAIGAHEQLSRTLRTLQESSNGCVDSSFQDQLTQNIRDVSIARRRFECLLQNPTRFTNEEALCKEMIEACESATSILDTTMFLQNKINLADSSDIKESEVDLDDIFLDEPDNKS